MKWNVYIYNINKHEIEHYNIFNHGGFIEYVKRHIRKYKNKDELADKIKSELMYYFWSKAEWELVIEFTKDNHIMLKPWCGCRNPEEVKIDVTDDTDFDWKAFVECYINMKIYGNKAKIDVFDQVMMKWNEFITYVWEHRKEILKYE